MRAIEAHRNLHPWRARRLLLATAVALSLFPAAQSQTRRTAAREQFLRAEKQRTALNGKPQKDRSVEEYTRLVGAYRRVYVLSPQAAEVTNALLAVAELYQDMGRLFDAKHFQRAIDAYQFLLHEYPASRFRDDALFTIAQIQQNDLQHQDLAEKSYLEFVKRYPRSARAEQAREALAAIAAAREQERAASVRGETPAARQQRRDAAGRTPQLTNIRHWNAENYTRIVIDVEDTVKYQGARISNPDRIYFDIHKARLSSTLAGKTLEVQNGFLKTIRVAQNQAGVVRLVLEVDKVKDYSIFLLPNPYRLVVDIFGEGLSLAKSTKPADSGPTTTKQEKSEPERSVTAEKTASPTAKPEKSSAARGETRGEESSRGASKTGESAKLTPPPVPQPTRDGQLNLSRALGLKIGRIVIDAGHGGHDTGTIGPSGLMEKDLCLDVARRLGNLIKERLPGTEVVYTRDDDTFVPLEDRAPLANQVRADLFLSIHANSSRDRNVRGVETYYLNFASSDEALEVAARENAHSQSSVYELQDIIKKIARNEKIEESRELAAEIQESLAKRLKRVSKATKNRGVKKAPFVVLIGANMPAVLAEVSFLSNPADESMMKKGEHRQRLAEGLFQGLQSYASNMNALSLNQPANGPGSPDR